MENVVIAAAVRTPIATFQGALASLKASELGGVVIAECMRRTGLEPDSIDLVVMGNVLSAGMGQAPARQAAIYGGLAKSTPAVTVNKMCGSGMEAIIQGVRAIQTGAANVVIAGGMESMSNAPYLLPKARAGLRLGDGNLVDSILRDGLVDVYGDKHMGSCAEMCAEKYEFSRADQDSFATRSYKRAQDANQRGAFEDEIVPVEVTGRKGDVTIVAEDEEPARVNYAKMSKLRAAFADEGTITAANASSINDGAAALVLCSQTFAEEKGFPILATIQGSSMYAAEPEWFSTAPVGAMQKLFETLSWSAEDVDFYEINEAFSVVTMAAMQEFDLPADKVNVHGGAVALGHPIGASAARIVVTLLHTMKQHDKQRGVASVCIGGGEALALGVVRSVPENNVVE